MNSSSKHESTISTFKQRIQRILEVFIVAFKLGCTSFGGPTAHLGYFHDEYITRRQWLDERSYAELVALCQVLPGPASSQIGIGIGVIRSGLWGGIAAWLGFTLPSMIALIVLAIGFIDPSSSSIGWIQGLKLVAVAIVTHAIIGMGSKLLTDWKRVGIAVIAMASLLTWHQSFMQVALILAAGSIGGFLFKEKKPDVAIRLPIPVRRGTAVSCLILFVCLLVGLPLLRWMTDLNGIAVFESFYRSGALVFGGGHVVLPLLESEVLAEGWVSKESFLAGYGATQAMPGPLFTFATYLGASMGGWPVALYTTIAIFLPAFLLVVGVLPFWERLRTAPMAQGVLSGINAAVVGILAAAWYDPIWVSSMMTIMDVVVACVLFAMLQFWKLPSWVVVLAGAGSGMILYGL